MSTAPGIALPSVPRTRRLYEIDIVRIVTFACVIAVHTTSYTVAPDDYVLNGLLALVHFTRQVFFALTAFVLLYGQLNKPVSMRTFWPKRFLLVGVPYLVWSTIYFVSANVRSPHYSVPDFISNYLIDVLTGTAWYHLYFLLVTMQVYLLVPLIIWFVKKTRGHHRTVLIVSFAIQLALMWFYKYGPHVPFAPYEKLVFLSYEFFIIAGAIAADHAPAFLAWVRGHRQAIVWIVLTGALLMIGTYLGQHFLLGQSLSNAGTPLQPVTMVWAVCVGLGFLAFGTWWADRRDPTSRSARWVDVVSDRSFGIFLSHPLVLWVLLWIGGGWVDATIPKPWLTPFAYVIVVLVAFVIADLSRRTLLSLPLAGRRFVRRERSPGRARSDRPVSAS
jgi:peptidoglycan/LPS O-acetylase OafA/YrhL